MICACALARTALEASSSKAARKAKVVEAIKETAERLGNTAAVCRASYVSPVVLDEFERGRVIEHPCQDVHELLRHRRGRLHSSERGLLRLLRARAA